MKFIPFIISLLIVTGMKVHSGPVTVKGRVNDAPGKVIRLMTYSDHISRLRQTIASDTISAEGEFGLQAEVPGTCYAWLDIGFQSAELFLKPGQEYTVEIGYDRQNVTSSYYDRLGLSLEIVRDDEDRTNLYIRDFNQLYNDFLLNYAAGGSSRNISGTFEAFRKAIQVRFQNVRSEYISGYIRYKTASMQLFLRLKSRDNLGLEYLSDQPVIYRNIEYMDFLHLFFEKYFIAGTKYFTYNKTNDLVNGTASLEAILDSLSADPVLESRELRELLLLQGMKELYGIPGFKKNRISGLIGELQ